MRGLVIFSAAVGLANAALVSRDYPVPAVPDTDYTPPAAAYPPEQTTDVYTPPEETTPVTP
ncbi:hypothetical protein FCIRC_2113, partial [Fusarium circinatum]